MNLLFLLQPNSFNSWFSILTQNWTLPVWSSTISISCSWHEDQIKWSLFNIVRKFDISNSDLIDPSKSYLWNFEHVRPLCYNSINFVETWNSRQDFKNCNLWRFPYPKYEMHTREIPNFTSKQSRHYYNWILCLPKWLS